MRELDVILSLGSGPKEADDIGVQSWGFSSLVGNCKRGCVNGSECAEES